MSEMKEPCVNEPERRKKRGCCCGGGCCGCCGGFFKRFWWLVLFIIIAIVVLVVCLVIFVGVPHTAQSKINKAKINIDGVSLTHAESNKFLLGINSTITTDGGIQADIEGFQGIAYLTNVGSQKPFVSFSFPPTNNAKFQVVNISEEVTIEDRDAFNEFNIWLFLNQTISITLEGKTKVKVRGLSKKFEVTFKKTVTMNALNTFKGTTVSDGLILSTTEDDGVNFEASAHIVNDSVFTLELGNTTLSSSVNGTSTGLLFIDNLTILPGNNTYPVTAQLDKAAILAIAFTQPFCTTGILPVSLVGNKTENHGQELVYYEQALASGVEIVDMNIAEILFTSLGLTLSCES